jgi:hypothetical protein
MHAKLSMVVRTCARAILSRQNQSLEPLFQNWAILSRQNHVRRTRHAGEGMCLSRDYSKHMIAYGSKTSINSPVKQHSSHAEQVVAEASHDKSGWRNCKSTYTNFESSHVQLTLIWYVLREHLVFPHFFCQACVKEKAHHSLKQHFTFIIFLWVIKVIFL